MDRRLEKLMGYVDAFRPRQTVEEELDFAYLCSPSRLSRD